MPSKPSASRSQPRVPRPPNSRRKPNPTTSNNKSFPKSTSTPHYLVVDTTLPSHIFNDHSLFTTYTHSRKVHRTLFGLDITIKGIGDVHLRIVVKGVSLIFRLRDCWHVPSSRHHFLSSLAVISHGDQIMLAGRTPRVIFPHKDRLLNPSLPKYMPFTRVDGLFVLKFHFPAPVSTLPISPTPRTATTVPHITQSRPLPIISLHASSSPPFAGLTFNPHHLNSAEEERERQREALGLGRPSMPERSRMGLDYLSLPSSVPRRASTTSPLSQQASSSEDPYTQMGIITTCATAPPFPPPFSRSPLSHPSPANSGSHLPHSYHSLPQPLSTSMSAYEHHHQHQWQQQKLQQHNPGSSSFFSPPSSNGCLAVDTFIGVHSDQIQLAPLIAGHAPGSSVLPHSFPPSLFTTTATSTALLGPESTITAGSGMCGPSMSAPYWPTSDNHLHPHPASLKFSTNSYVTPPTAAKHGSHVLPSFISPTVSSPSRMLVFGLSV